MCGFVGYLGKGDKSALKSMADTLKHRGPDDEGFLVFPKCGFGFRRLSIIDVAGGHQPMQNEDGSIAVMLNGEIYNFNELRDGLLKKGHRFKSRSDAEVIVHLYEDIGEKVFEQLNGMFAIALYDSRSDTLFLVRDRLGKKPLYYGEFQSAFLFASEPKAILASPYSKKELDFDSLNLYLTYEFIPTPRSIFKNIYKLEPGHYLVLNSGKAALKKFWDLELKSENEVGEKEALEIFDKKIEEAVRVRLVSDVPLGVYLSGGLDSSMVTWYASRLSPKPLETFTISFKEQSYDESAYAKMVSEALKTNHHEQRLESKDALKIIDEAIEIFDEPLADASILPTMLLAKFSRNYVTVALGGDGGDELFLGYQNVKAHILNRWYCKMPVALRRFLIEPLVKFLPPDDRYFSFSFKAKRFLRGWGLPPFYQDLLWRGSFSDEEKTKILKIPLNSGLAFKELDRRLAEAASGNFFQKLSYLYLKQYLMDGILVKVDRSSMAFSQEVRAPLLDYNVVECVANLPDALKFRCLEGKYLLKKIMSGRLPEEIIKRKKQGFAVPVSQWLREDLKPLADKLFSEKYLSQQGIFNPEEVRTLYDSHLLRKADFRKELWTLLIFQLWYDRWIK